MFGLVKIQERIPGNKHILLKTSFSCEIQQVIWVIWLKTEKMKLVDGGHLEFSYLDLSKIQKWCQTWALYATFTFKLHFRYGRRRPSWILMVGLVKIQKRCQKWILHAISRESGITQLSISICFLVTFPIWPTVAILYIGFSQIPPPFSRWSWGLNFF